MDKFFSKNSRKNVVGQTTHNVQDKTKNKISSNSWTEKRITTTEDWKKHFNGTTNLGLSPLLEDNYVRWAVIDIDYYPFDIISFSKMYKDFPFLSCTTKSGGAHIYFFFKRKRMAKEVVGYLKELVTLLYDVSGIYFDSPTKVEIFPKQIKIKETSQANWLNLPYFNNGIKQYCVYDGEKVLKDHFINMIENNLIDNFEKEILNKFLLYNSTPCLKRMSSNGVIEGKRDTFLFNAATFFKFKYPEIWKDKVRELNLTLDDPLSNASIQRNIIDQHEKNNVFYQCKSDLYPYCDRIMCKKTMYGCKKENDPASLIGGITKIMTQPIMWQVEISNKKILLESTTELLNQRVFRNLCVEELHVIPPLIPGDEWDELIQEKLDSLTIEEAPEDATADSPFFSAIESYILQNSSSNNTVDNIDRGQVYIEDGFNFFKIQYLIQHLRRNSITNYKNNKIFALIKSKGGFCCRKKVNEVATRVWSYPLLDRQKVRAKLGIPDFAKYETEEEF